jgi:hypothetical protein
LASQHPSLTHPSLTPPSLFALLAISKYFS